MNLSFLWHFHQPPYRHPETGEYVLPYVLIHSLKNYDQMALLHERHRFPSTFNFTPCLLGQIREYASGLAPDPLWRALNKPARELRAEELHLLERFSPITTAREKAQLQALHSFFSPAREPFPADTGEASSLAQEILHSLLPRYRKLEEEKIIELTTSPYYHPLLPLLIDIRAAAGVALPDCAFHYPEDALLQLQQGREVFFEIFGKKPEGLWPPEGAVSQEAAALASQAGFAYLVSDEDVLWKSLAGEKSRKFLYNSYKVDGLDNLNIFFRDRELSDLIGFVYHRWEEKEAVAHFAAQLRLRFPLAGEEGICVVALDGENPWPFYRKNGLDFLERLFTLLQEMPEINLIHPGSYSALHPAASTLKLAPGTWLGGFSKWLGNKEKNALWEELSRARAACGQSEAILAAEGSDWFWWAGETEEPAFDLLFHAFLKEACRQKREGS